jgi:hypothetical protein
MNSGILEIQSLALAQGLTLDPSLLKDYPLGTYFWAVHHQTIFEPLTEPLANRIEYILTDKAANERAVRLAALRPVKDAKACDKACATYDKARATYAKARAKAYDKAYDKACATHDKALLALWAQEYPDHPKWGISGLVLPE